MSVQTTLGSIARPLLGTQCNEGRDVRLRIGAILKSRGDVAEHYLALRVDEKVRGNGDVAAIGAGSRVNDSVLADHFPTRVRQNRKRQTQSLNDPVRGHRVIHGDRQQAPARFDDSLMRLAELTQLRDTEWSPIPAIKNQKHGPLGQFISQTHRLPRLIG